MTQYIVINTVLTFAALAVNHWMHIPHRTRFRIVLLALVLWTVPLGLMHIKLSTVTVNMLNLPIFKLLEPTPVDKPASLITFNWMYVFGILVLIGLVRLTADVISMNNLKNKIMVNATDHICNIKFSHHINGAFVTGYFKPIIWISQDYKNTQQLASIITHEQQHVKQHDQFWLLLITTIQRLMWFNPLVQILSNKSRESIELSCDEACKQTLGKNTYQQHLTQITLMQHNNQTALFNNQINQDNNFNLFRIKQLKQENTMTKNQILKLTATGIITSLLCLYSMITIANNTTAPALKDGQVFIELKLTINQQQTQELSLIANDQETAEVKFNGYALSIKPSVIAPPVNTTAEPTPTQIMNQITLSRINSDQITSSLSNPTLLALNQEWAGMKVTHESIGDIQIELKSTVN